jgi:succinate dehydrogenase / fumarate reductase cytochrome b subunit
MAKGLFGSSIGRKIIMGFSGLFLITFLLVHCAINALIFFRDGGLAFNKAAHFMATNPLVRSMEIFLFLGLILHIIDGIMLWRQNTAARPVAYNTSSGNASSKWYSRKMGLLGSLILLFLIFHLAHFWVKSRITGLNEVVTPDGETFENMYVVMLEIFSNPIWVILYVLACIAVAYHLLHGFKSAFQSLGLNHSKYNGFIASLGALFAIIIPLVFAMMPLAVFFNCVN